MEVTVPKLTCSLESTRLGHASPQWLTAILAAKKKKALA
jgi:hypothetical protein